MGPPAVPPRHVRSDSHQPQPLRAVHAPHAVSAAHGSGATHSERSHAQLGQLPLSGPLALPSVHAPVAPQKPHGYSPVHASQVVWRAQVPAPPHSEETQLQSPHVPALGPAPVPLRHAPAPSPQ